MDPTQLVIIAPLLPFIFSSLASTLAGLINQEKWPALLNECIVYAIVIVFALIDAYVTGRVVSGNLSTIIATVTGIATGLLSTSCKPLLRWTLELQQRAFVFDTTGFHLYKSASTTPAVVPVASSPVPSVQETPTAKTPSIAAVPSTLVTPQTAGKRTEFEGERGNG